MLAAESRIAARIYRRLKIGVVVIRRHPPGYTERSRLSGRRLRLCHCYLLGRAHHLSKVSSLTICRTSPARTHVLTKRATVVDALLRKTTEHDGAPAEPGRNARSSAASSATVQPSRYDDPVLTAYQCCCSTPRQVGWDAVAVQAACGWLIDLGYAVIVTVSLRLSLVSQECSLRSCSQRPKGMARAACVRTGARSPRPPGRDRPS